MKRPARDPLCISTRRRSSAAAGGFTLMELLVVIVIFGIFAAMAYGGLNSVLNARRQIEISLARTAEYQRAYIRLRDDFVNGSARTIRDGDGRALSAFTYERYNKRVEFTRGGWSNPALLPRATLERVSYFLDDSKSDNGKVIRRSWRVLDRASQSEPVDLNLLEHIDEMHWRFLDKNLAWQDQWPAPSATPTGNGSNTGVMPVPNAVELTMRSRDWGELRFLFRLGPDGLGCQSGASSGGGSGSSSGGC